MVLWGMVSKRHAQAFVLRAAVLQCLLIRAAETTSAGLCKQPLLMLDELRLAMNDPHRV